VPRRALAVLVLVLLTACRADTDVVVHAAADGSGRIEVVVGLDKEAAARAAGAKPRTDDLAAAGWTVHPAERQKDGGVVYRVEKPFRSPDEAARVLQEVSTDTGPLRDLRVVRERSFLRTRTRLTGAVDLTAGAAAFGDPEHTQQLGGQPLGVDAPHVAPLEKALRLQVVAELPGATRRWAVRPGQRVPVSAVAEQWNVLSILFAVVAVLALVAFGVSVRRAVRRGRPVPGSVTPPP
jgi:hypothetical protein